MDTFFQLVAVCGSVGALMVAVGSFFGMVPAALVGALVCLVPAMALYLSARNSGALVFMRPQRRNEVIVLFRSGLRRIYPLLAEEGMERYLRLRGGYGRIRITKNSDYTMCGKKVVLASAGVPVTIPMEMAAAASKLREMGFKNFKEVATAVEKMREVKGYEEDTRKEEEEEPGA